MEAQLPDMLRMLDPASFVDHVRLPVRLSIKVGPRRQAVRAVLLAAQGPSEELEQQLRELGTQPRWTELDGHTAAFVRRRLAAFE